MPTQSAQQPTTVYKASRISLRAQQPTRNCRFLPAQQSTAAYKTDRLGYSAQQPTPTSVILPVHHATATFAAKMLINEMNISSKNQSEKQNYEIKHRANPEMNISSKNQSESENYELKHVKI